MRIALARQGLNNALAHLEKHTQINNVLTIESEGIISWAARDPGIIKGVYYPLEYQHLLDRHQYSILLSDGSFFQFFYQFDDKDALSKARLAFYPRPIPSGDSTESLLLAAEEALDREDNSLYEHLFNYIEEMDRSDQTPSNTSHIRFDFDRDVTAHSQSHLQFSGVHEWRVPAGFYPQPLAFVQLCESLIAGVQPLLPEALGFERNHPLKLDLPPQLIILGCG